MKFSIKDFFIKCDQMRSFLRIWSHLLKKLLMENFIFCAVSRLVIPFNLKKSLYKVIQDKNCLVGFFISYRLKYKQLLSIIQQLAFSIFNSARKSVPLFRFVITSIRYQNHNYRLHSIGPESCVLIFVRTSNSGQSINV